MERTITVVGHGAATVVPDTAVVRVAVSAVAETVARAWEQVTAATDRALAAARREVDDPALEAHAVNLWPRTEPDGQQRFEARRGVVVHCADLGGAGALLEVLVAEVGDALQVEGIGVEVADAAEALERARDEAFGDAEAKARRLAARAGAALGEVVTIDESGGVAGPGPRVLRADAALVPGEQRLEASLQVTWLLA